MLAAFEAGDFVEIVNEGYKTICILGSIFKILFADRFFFHCSIEKRFNIALDGEDGWFKFMCKILKELLSVCFVPLKQLDLVILVFHPFFNIFLNFVYAFRWKNIFVVDLFFTGGLGLIDKFVDKLDFSVYEFLERETYKAVAAKKDDDKSDSRYLDIESKNVDTKRNRYAQCKRYKSRQLVG